MIFELKEWLIYRCQSFYCGLAFGKGLLPLEVSSCPKCNYQGLTAYGYDSGIVYGRHQEFKCWTPNENQHKGKLTKETLEAMIKEEERNASMPMDFNADTIDRPARKLEAVNAIIPYLTRLPRNTGKTRAIIASLSELFGLEKEWFELEINRMLAVGDMCGAFEAKIGDNPKEPCKTAENILAGARSTGTDFNAEDFYGYDKGTFMEPNIDEQMETLEQRIIDTIGELVITCGDMKNSDVVHYARAAVDLYSMLSHMRNEKKNQPIEWKQAELSMEREEELKKQCLKSSMTNAKRILDDFNSHIQDRDKQFIVLSNFQIDSYIQGYRDCYRERGTNAKGKN